MGGRCNEPMLWHWPDFWESDDVQIMSAEQVVAYQRLLSAQWTDGALPTDPTLLALKASAGVRHVTVDAFVGTEVVADHGDGRSARDSPRPLADPCPGSIWAGIQQCFEIRDDGVFNRRVEKERVAWIIRKGKNQEQRVLAGKASGRARARKAAELKKIASQSTIERVVERLVQRVVEQNPTPLPLPSPSPDGEEEGEGKRPPHPPGLGLCPAEEKDAEKTAERIKIPEPLAVLGLTVELLADRIATRPGPPKAGRSWTMELNLLAGLVREHGALVLDVFRMAIAEEWKSCSPQIVADRAAKAKKVKSKAAGNGKGANLNQKDCQILTQERAEELGLDSRMVWEGEPGWGEGQPWLERHPERTER